MLATLIAPLALVLSPAGPAAPVADDVTAQQVRDEDGERTRGGFSEQVADWLGLQGMGEVPTAGQVRIERRVILRISPRPGPARRSMMAELPQQPMQTRMVEQPMGKCIKAGDIVGVSDRGNRLLMFMRDQRIVAAQLEKACSPRDFYRGFYLEPNGDGNLCVKRDRLLSRAGAKCQVTALRRLVAVQQAR
ncbi:hypothetical protein [Qipengyuania marisflavi]|uniref:Uncharacterized protein n=1 Tax=Qipengyuania marisflavi TaxID=2486356 RepID=A0A5S3P9M1_9SPHN|nr:hypothetical protein [Qipengyuania marisflavi]TMM50156.1 hypothetical protein FEV51_02915 [Qipengyuania marisflavi]